jgi:hypothetical protein
VGKRVFGAVAFDPAVNPAVLDTLTWDEEAARAAALSAGLPFWERAAKSLAAGGAAPLSDGITLFASSAARAGESLLALGELADGQHVIARFGRRGDETAGRIADAAIDGGRLSIHRADSDTLYALYAAAAPARLPAAMGSVPRLGIGTRMSRLSFPGIWRAVARCGCPANVIQNSCRELSLLDNVLNARASRSLYYPGFGFVPEGHTGSTFEGLWTCGVAESLKHGNGARYGADADHIMIKRGPEGMDAARKVVDAARFYSFYTLDVSDLVVRDARQMPAAPGSGEAHRDLRAWHAEEKRVGDMRVSFRGEDLARRAGAYGAAMEAAESLGRYIGTRHRGGPFDLELSVDEHPPEVPAFDCLTDGAELFFILSEAARRGIPLTHVAPNVGVEKLVDYRGAGGLAGLKSRVERLHAIARHFNVLLDFHSGDDLSPATRAALRQSTGGSLHFKVSPVLQNLLGEALHECAPELFGEWWAEALADAREAARQGSEHARACLASDPSEMPDPGSELFKAYCFAAVGRRDAQGACRLREKLYSIPAACREAYDSKVSDWLCGCAGDLFGGAGAPHAGC